MKLKTVWEWKEGCEKVKNNIGGSFSISKTRVFICDDPTITSQNKCECEKGAL